MIEVFKDSFIYKTFNKIIMWLSTVFSQSFFVQKFVSETNSETIDSNTIFSKAMTWIISVLQKIARKIKLDKLFENSIFAKPIIWLAITIFLIPFLPTMVVLALVIITTLSLFLKVLITPNLKLKYFKSNTWILIFVLVICICAATSISKAESRNIAMLLSAFILFYFVVINTIETKSQLKFILYVFIIGGLISALYGLYQYAFGDLYSQAWLDSDMFEDIKMRVYSTLENPNVYGEYLLLVIPIVFSLLWTEKRMAKEIISTRNFGDNNACSDSYIF